jgi:proton-dependent oligopeptide transporter, POT family
LVFANESVDRNLFGIQIPASFFASAEPIFIVILSPFISKLWDILAQRGIKFTTLTKLLSGLFITSLSFMIFYICSRHSLNGTKVSEILFLSGFALLGLGELLIMPSIIAEVSYNETPLKLKGTVMGSIFLSLAFSSYFAGIIATFTASSSFEMVYKNLSLFLLFFIFGVIIIKQIWNIFKRKFT